MGREGGSSYLVDLLCKYNQLYNNTVQQEDNELLESTHKPERVTISKMNWHCYSEAQVNLAVSSQAAGRCLSVFLVDASWHKGGLEPCLKMLRKNSALVE